MLQNFAIQKLTDFESFFLQIPLPRFARDSRRDLRPGGDVLRIGVVSVRVHGVFCQDRGHPADAQRRPADH